MSVGQVGLNIAFRRVTQVDHGPVAAHSRSGCQIGCGDDGGLRGQHNRDSFLSFCVAFGWLALFLVDAVRWSSWFGTRNVAAAFRLPIPANRVYLLHYCRQLHIENLEDASDRGSAHGARVLSRVESRRTQITAAHVTARRYQRVLLALEAHAAVGLRVDASDAA